MRMKVWWKCSKNHSYQAIVGNRTKKNGTNCPYCANKKVLKGFNDLLTKYPDIAKEWDYKKNEIKPDEVTGQSNKDVYWLCPLGHSYHTLINSRTAKHTNCHYCSNCDILKGFNDLLTKYPNIVKEWDYSKNTIKPDEIGYFSNKKVYWLCQHKHSYLMAVNNKTLAKQNCPYCSGRKVLKGFNDLLTTHPKLIKMWDFEKNKNINIYNISKGMHKKVYWTCEKGHSWLASVNNVSKTVYRRCPCPYCNPNNSFGENIIACLLSNYYQVEQRKKHRINNKLWETDIYLPELNIGIEFNGWYWHRNKQEYDNLKEQALSSKMKVFYILEGIDNKIIGNKIYFNKRNYYKNLNWSIKELFKILNINDNIDIKINDK